MSPTPPAGVKAPKLRPIEFWALVGIGLVSGFFSGLFGIGGGLLVVPALVVLLKVDQRLAVGTSLLAILPAATASAWSPSRTARWRGTGATCGAWASSTAAPATGR